MTPSLRWLEELGDDVADTGGARIFVPSIMGAGLVLSIGIVLGDLVRRIAPRSGRMRHRRRAVKRAIAFVAPIATAASMTPPTIVRPRQRLRSRSFYVVAFCVTTSFSLYVGIGATFNFMRGFGPFSGHLAMEVFSLTVSILTFVLALMIGVIALRHPRPPAWTEAVIDFTPLGASER